ncbi:MAG TPA: aminoglycoside phosphotransferase family protein [Candidatus Melainabacteria bacterium]|nr:aminoglycoside phosphotransferase family protein [Candidatus Melainabacteria bacterium]HIN66665.1 aminoglycoside phosphotransferase family protein [Candidatus Obscuribacterales bacterium]
MSNSKKDFDFGELKAVLEDAYAIGEITRIESITCDEEELLLANDFLPKSNGSNDSVDVRTSFRIFAETGEYFLKTVSSWIDDSRLRDVETFIEWFNRRSTSPSPVLIVSKGGYNHIKKNGARYQLFSFIQQEKRYVWMKPEMTSSDCTFSGALLAKIHLSAFQFEEEVASSRSTMFQDSPALSVKSDIPFRETYESLFEHVYSRWTHKHPLLSRVRHSNRPLLARFGMAAHIVSCQNDERLLTLVHGDYHPGNILFSRTDDGHISGSVVDFDHMRWEHPFYDIAYALIMFARKPVTNSDTTDVSSFGMQRIDWSLARSFIDGYVNALRSIPSDSIKLQSFKSELVKTDANLLGWYMNLGCYLILAWAAEKVNFGSDSFSEVYLGVLEMSYHLLCDDAFHYAEKIWSASMNESPV